MNQSIAKLKNSTKEIDQTNPCGYCKQKGSIVLYDTVDTHGDAYKVNSCTHCKAIFLSPRPTAAQLARAYDDSYYGEQDDKFPPIIEKALDYFRSSRAKLVTEHADPPAKVLDIGCGNGKFLQYVLQAGDYDAYGIELPGKAAERAAAIPNLTLKQGSLEEGDFAPNSMDVITLFHVFEHLAEPMKRMQVIQKILKPGGVLIMSFPNIDSFQSSVFKGKWLHLDPPRHLFFFRPADFVAEMKNYGLHVEKTTFFSTEQNPFGMQQSILNSLTSTRELLYEDLKGNKHYVAKHGYSKLNMALQKAFWLTTAPLFIVSDMLESGFKKGATVEFVLRKK